MNKSRLRYTCKVCGPTLSPPAFAIDRLKMSTDSKKHKYSLEFHVRTHHPEGADDWQSYKVTSTASQPTLQPVQPVQPVKSDQEEIKSIEKMKKKSPKPRIDMQLIEAESHAQLPDQDDAQQEPEPQIVDNPDLFSTAHTTSNNVATPYSSEWLSSGFTMDLPSCVEFHPASDIFSVLMTTFDIAVLNGTYGLVPQSLAQEMFPMLSQSNIVMKAPGALRKFRILLDYFRWKFDYPEANLAEKPKFLSKIENLIEELQDEEEGRCKAVIRPFSVVPVRSTGR